MKKEERINELDIIRGLCMIGVLMSHLWFDLEMFFPMPALPDAVIFIFQNGGILFVIISGLCSTLGKRNLRRGMIVFLCGMLITGVTFLLAQYENDPGIVVRFGILHLIGICMILSPLMDRLPRPMLPFLILFMIIAGIIFQNRYVESPYFFPLGLITREFSSGDYWPLFPNLGYFLFGRVIGYRLYPVKEPIFPNLQNRFPVFSFLGRYSLFVYLLSQPIIITIIYGISRII